VPGKTRFVFTASSCLLTAVLGATAHGDEPASYEVPDAALELEVIDRSEKESFLSVCADTEGRLFVGSREAVFAYDPDGKGGFEKPVELYRFPSHSWVYDIAVRGNDLYVQTTTTTYVMPDGRIKRKDLTVKPLLWGLPSGSYSDPSWGVHQGMHALAWGPEGDLYVSFGGMLWYYGDFERPDHWGHWYFYTADGANFTYNGQGGILRIRPDGSKVQMVATGLRNPCGLAFDNQWNLFSHDNDHESMPAQYIPGRLLHVTDGTDFAWPRGWMVTKSPDRKDLLQTMYGGMGRTVPVGQSYYDEPLLPAKYRDNILLARWGQRTLAAYPKWPSGATYRAKEQVLVSCRGNARPVGVTVGPCGRIFSAVCYMEHNEKSPIYQSDLIVISKTDNISPATTGVDVVQADVTALYGLLGAASCQLRQAAHLELLRRSDPALDQALDSLQSNPSDSQIKDNRAVTQWIHLAAASKSDAAGCTLQALAQHSDAQIRQHAIRALGEHAELNASRSLFVKSLNDDSAAVQLEALEALIRFDRLPSEVVEGPARSDDTYLRQAAIRLMADKMPVGELETLLHSLDAKSRLAAVLALGRQLTVPRMDFVPPEKLKLGETVGPQIYLDREVIDLSKLERIGHYTIADYWQVASSSHQQHFDLLIDCLNDLDESVRLQAAYFLSLLKDKRSEPLIDKVHNEATEGRLTLAKSIPISQIWMCGPFPDPKRTASEAHNLRTRHPPEKGAVDVTASYGNGDNKVSWEKIFREDGDFSSHLPSRGSLYSTYASFEIQSPVRQRIWLEFGTDGAGAVWQNGRSVWHRVRQLNDTTTEGKVSLALQAGSNQFLVRCQVGAKGYFALRVRALERIAAAITEPENVTLAQRLKNATLEPTDSNLDEFLSVNWNEAATEGNVVQGRNLFASIGCAKCHAVSGSIAVTGGPSLADAGRRFTPDYLVESVLLPSKKISAFFISSSIVTVDGKVLVGLITSENQTEVELLLPDAKRLLIKKEDIEERKESSISAMPQGMVKTPEELRDVLSYLLMEK